LTNQEATPSLSVVIPTANRAKLVVRAVESVLSAAGSDVEVVVADDASTDDTVDCLKGLQDPRLHIVELPQRSGANTARNAGAQASRAPLLAFLDSDDVFEPGRSERLIRLFAETPDLDAVMDDFKVWTGDRVRLAGQPGGVWRGDRLTLLLIAHAVPLTNSALTIRRSVFDEVGGFDVAFNRQQDRDILLRVARSHAVACGTGQDVAKYQIVRSMSRNHDGYIEAFDMLVGNHPAFLSPEFRDLVGYLTARGIVKAIAQGDLPAAWREMRALRQARHLPFGFIGALVRYPAGRRFRRATRQSAKAVPTTSQQSARG
jgi:glycosyltransferase involved in cell wall biosynthesis